MADPNAATLRRSPKADEDQHLMEIYEDLERKRARTPLSARCRDCWSPTQMIMITLLMGLVFYLVSTHPQCNGTLHEVVVPVGLPTVERKTGAGSSLAVGSVETRVESTKGVGASGSMEMSAAAPVQRVSDVAANTSKDQDEKPLMHGDFSKLLKERAVNNQIVLAVATSSFTDMTLNLLCSFDKIHLTNYIVGALDQEIYDLLKRRGVPVIAAYRDSILGGEELKSAVRRREDFHKVNFVKEEIVEWAMDEGYEAAMTDTDVVWYRNPMKNLEENFRNYDYAFQVAVVEENGDHLLNGGFFYVKPTDAAKGAMKILLSRLYEDFGRNDQSEFRNVLCLDERRVSNNTCYDSISGARTLLLPITKYAKGALINEDEDYKAALLRHNPFTIHYNGGASDRKQWTMESHGLWYLDENMNCRFQS